MSKKVKKKKSPHEERVANFMTGFYGKEKKLANRLKGSLAILKDEYNLTEIIAVARQLDKNPAARQYFFGNPLPQSYGELRQGEYSYQTNLEKELNWYVLSLVNFSGPVNSFVQLRDLYEKALLIGDYDTASAILDQIENTICYSFWGMEQRFLIAELSGGLKKNKDFLSDVNNSTQDPFVTTFAYFFSNRAENKMSVQRFNNLFNNFFVNLSAEVREYFQFIVNDLGSDSYKELHIVLSYHNFSSIIDRYITFLKVSQLILARNLGGEFLFKIIQRVKKLIADRLVDGLLLFHPVPDASPNFEETGEAIAIFDSYSCGDYKQAIDQAKKFLQRCPNELSIYEIYIKAHLFLRKEFLSAIPGENLSSQILDNMYNVIEKNDTTLQSLANLLKIATTLQNLSFGVQLNAFYNRSVSDGKNSSWRSLEILNAQILNPVLVKRFASTSDAANYLQLLTNAYPESATVGLFCEYLKPEESKSKNADLEQIPAYRTTFYRAESDMQRGSYESAIRSYNELLLSDNLNIVLYEDALINLLESYFKTGQYEQYLQVYVYHYFKNPNLLIRADTKPVVKQLQTAKFRNVSPSIVIPIFFYITKQDSHNINIALRVFLRDVKLIRSADLRQKAELLDIGLLKFLLYNVCTPEILKYSTYFAGTNDILLERVEVLQILLVIDKPQSSVYDAEISKITQSLAVSDAIRQIDESKIYVDESSLINSEFSDIRNNYNRYIEISRLISDQRSSFIDISFNRKILFKVTGKQIVAEDLGHAKVSKNVKFELFKEVFFEIRDAFLFNNRYGLDVYLSTRIRHGTLLGQFRNEFQAQNLITQKEKSTGKYFRNDYWEQKLAGLDEVKRNRIQDLLAAFSGKIDTIANDLKERAIQIKTEDRNVSGLFDYKIANEELLVYYDRVFKTIDHYNDFVHLAIQLLWRLTEANLKYVRQFISVNIKDKLLSELSALETDLIAIAGEEKDIQELVNSIKICRTQIHSELDKIADWFHIRRVEIPDFQISKVINSSLEITNKISQSAKILAPDITIAGGTIFKGKFFIHLFDLLRIFLENIVNYSELVSSELRVELSAIEKEDGLHFRIINNLGPLVGVEALREKFTIKAQELSTVTWDMDKIRTEKDTGFYKAKKNLTSDLQDEGNHFDFRVNEEDKVEINIFININKLKA